MRKKLDTRFPAARIKKIMQTDEDVGKIAMAVPVLVSKALELFLQDLCDRTYNITVQRGAKTVNSLHLKHCVHNYNVFDFLREVVSKVPDYSNSDAAADTSKRRKVVNELNESEEEPKRSSMQQEASPANSTGRGRGRGRGRGHGRARRAAEIEAPQPEIESNSITSQQSIGQTTSPRMPTDDNNPNGSGSRNFDLNAGVDEGSDKMASSISAAGLSDVKGEDSGLSEIDRMVIDPVHIVQLGSRLDEEEEEDYDEEG